MAQKNASPRKDLAESIRRAKLNPLFWVVIRDLNRQLILKHRATGEIKVIPK